MGMEGFVNPRVLRHSARAKSRGYGGDTRGEGTQLGGVIVAGPARATGDDETCDVETPTVLYREGMGRPCALERGARSVPLVARRRRGTRGAPLNVAPPPSRPPSPGAPARRTLHAQHAGRAILTGSPLKQFNFAGRAPSCAPRCFARCTNRAGRRRTFSLRISSEVSKRVGCQRLLWLVWHRCVHHGGGGVFNHYLTHVVCRSS